MLFSEMRCKEVINLQDGTKLGFVDDMEFLLPDAKICAIIVHGKARCFGLFGRDEDIYIPWKDIQKVGEDTVLVCIDRPNCCQKEKRSFFASLFK